MSKMCPVCKTMSENDDVCGNCNSSLTTVPSAGSISKPKFSDSDETPIEKRGYITENEKYDIVSKCPSGVSSIVGEAIEIHNNAFVENIMMIDRDYFDHILDDISGSRIMLSDEQRRAVITDDDNCLLIAGAGSGKTTTMTAKVKFLVDKKGVDPSKILVISFTNAAVKELRQHIVKELRIGAKVSTFHSFSNSLLIDPKNQSGDAGGMRRDVIQDGYKYTLFMSIIDDLIGKDNTMLKNLVLFMGYYFNLPDDLFDYPSIEDYQRMKLTRDYNTFRGNQKSYGLIVLNRKNKKMETILGERLRSAEEVQIANFLYLNSLDYEYESKYPHRIPQCWSRYTPDFLITQGEHSVYLEHFGLTEGMDNTRYSEDELQTYRKRIEDKRRLHERYHTTLLNTWSLYDDGRPLVQHLEEILKNEGFILKPRDLKEVFETVLKTGKGEYYDYFVKFTVDFIDRFKTKGYDIEDFDRLIETATSPRTNKFLEIAKEVFVKYQEWLKEKNKLDYADMINEACVLLQNKKDTDEKTDIEYIIIDEFQDIARQRFNLVKLLSETSGAKTVAVGDDWQSIYAFSGSEIELFTRFLELMGSGKKLEITHTYRNSQELIDIAGRFVQENPLQIRKRLVSNKHLDDPIVIRQYPLDVPPMIGLGQDVEQIIGEIIDEFGIESSILLLGRYGFDRRNLCTSPLFDSVFDKVVCNKYPDANITFMTVHSSKGLGFDNVIILNMTEGKYGFPCQIEEDPIMKLVIKEDETIPFSEERRLMYVAMTRTKNRVYITAPENKPSRFVIELVEKYGIPHNADISNVAIDPIRYRCPKCGYPLRYEFNTTYEMPLYICTNDPELCDFVTNDKHHPHMILKCMACERKDMEGYLLVRHRDKDIFYGCTNYQLNHSYSCGNMIPIEKSCNDEELAIAVSKAACSENVENEQSTVHKKDIIESEPDVTVVADEK